MNIQEINNDFKKGKNIDEYSMQYELFYMRPSIEEKIEVLKEISKVNLLAALISADKCEKDIAPEIIPKVFLKDILELDNSFLAGEEQATANMQCVLIVLKYLEEEKLIEVVNAVFSREEGFHENKNMFYDYSDMTIHYAVTMSNAINNMPYTYNWEEAYSKIVLAVSKARREDPNFANRLEARLREKRFVETHNWMFEYFLALYNIGAYDGAKFFLDKIWNPSSRLFGLEDDEFIKRFCSFTSPKLVSFCYEYMSVHNTEYTEDEWFKDVLKYNADPETIKWVKVDRFFYKLYQQIVENGQEYDELINDAKDIVMFDLKKCTYAPKMMSRLAQIFNKFILENRDVCAFIDRLGVLNLYDYRYIQDMDTYKEYKRVRDNTDFAALEKKLFQLKDPEKVLKIFMNTHLRFEIDLRDVIEYIDQLVPSKNDNDQSAPFKEIFQKYPIDGTISAISYVQTARDKIFLKPRYLYTKWDYTYSCGVFRKNHYKPNLETQEAYNKVIRNDQNWYDHNKEWSELLSVYDECTFYISKYIRVDSLILASDITKKDYEKEKKEREHLPNIVIGWLEEIKRDKKLVDWNERYRIYGIRNVKDMQSRERVALAILETIIELSEDENEIKKLLRLFRRYPMEEINEFRYIATQKWHDFYMTDFIDMIKKIQKLADTILKSESLSPGIKLEIYFNTCIKKFYELEKVCRYIGNEVFAGDARCIMPLTYIGRKDNQKLFAIENKPNKNVIYTRYDILYEGPEELKKNWIYFANLKQFDKEKQCFRINQLFLSEKDVKKLDDMLWQKYLICIVDLKNSLSAENKEEVRQNLEEITVDITSSERIKQFSGELDGAFHHYGFDVQNCDAILGVLNDTNPFVIQSNSFEDYQDYFMKFYSESYETFLQDIENHKRAISAICNVYFLSYLRIITPWDQFISDMERIGYRRVEIENCSRIAHYI